MIRFASFLRLALMSASLGAAALATSSKASTFDTAVENTPGLLGYYPFTPASQADSVVNGYTGVLENGASVGGPGSGPPVSDPSSSALVLANGSGGTEYATAGGSNPLQGQIDQAGSIVGWFNLASLPSEQGRIFSVAGESTVGDDFDLQIDGGNTLDFYTQGGGAVGGQDAFTDSDIGKWHFFAATFTADDTGQVYIDGQLIATGGTGGHSLSDDASFYVGQSNVFGNRYFDGSISDVGVFNTDLTAAQVAGLYASSFVPPVSPAPEPSTWTLMISGVGMAGAALRFGRRRGSPAAA